MDTSEKIALVFAIIMMAGLLTIAVVSVFTQPSRLLFHVCVIATCTGFIGAVTTLEIQEWIDMRKRDRRDI